ncbi:Pectinesterase inhibitor [Corchorus olitorius]|uniref:Pectinesterase inhibitor n=1 Tax=Corchorus olitorius TaxID=93759 RepID=A0A1R3IHY1_9ROSI|nr:Pectinesterase inhibitor [Corchorus olitorius]
MGSLKCFSSILTIFLAMISLFLSGCHADHVALIDSICKKSHDYEFCSTRLSSDPRSPNVADLNGFALISISLTITQIHSTLDRIPGILVKLNDPLEKQRLEACRNHYSTSVGDFHNSFTFASRHDYWETFNSVRDGTNRVIDCHNGYRMDGPIATSPIDGDDHDVIKLSGIIMIIVDDLIRRSAGGALHKTPVYLPVHL